MSTLLEPCLSAEQRAEASRHDEPPTSAFDVGLRSLRGLVVRNVADLQRLLEVVEHVVEQFEVDARDLDLCQVLHGIELAKAAANDVQPCEKEPEPWNWYAAAQRLRGEDE